jgi:hypothetical protein
MIMSPGIGNSPIPESSIREPSTWAMRLMGFAGLGLARSPGQVKGHAGLTRHKMAHRLGLAANC